MLVLVTLERERASLAKSILSAIATSCVRAAAVLDTRSCRIGSHDQALTHKDFVSNF